MVAICDSATLAVETEVAMLCAELDRSVWIADVVAFNDCASDCAARNADTCADALPGLEDSACSAVVSLLKAYSSVPASPGLPYTD